jgi:hypothetical protein
VLLVFNTATGVIETDVPFDLRGRRLVSYRLDDATGDRKAVQDGLASTLAEGLRVALASPPPVRRRPASKRAATVSPEQQRQRDRDALYDLLAVLDTEWVDAYFRTLADERIPHDAEPRWILFEGAARAARFHLFDRRTRDAVRAFTDAWHRMHEVTAYGDALPGEPFVRFRPESYQREADVDATRREFHEARAAMQRQFAVLVARVRAAYPEFDLRETDARARAVYDRL